jgi:hypothetical protein
MEHVYPLALFGLGVYMTATQARRGVPRYIAITSILSAIGSKYKQLRSVSLHKFDADPYAAKQESYDFDNPGPVDPRPDRHLEKSIAVSILC